MKITKKESVRSIISKAVLLASIVLAPVVTSAQTFQASINFGSNSGINSGYSSGYNTGPSYSNGSVNSASACSTQQQTLCTLVVKTIGYFNQAIYLIIALAVVTFIWNVYKYFIISDPENRKEASKYVMFSVIGLFVILSFWGLVNIVSNTLNLNTSPSAINVQALTGQ